MTDQHSVLCKNKVIQIRQSQDYFNQVLILFIQKEGMIYEIFVLILHNKTTLTREKGNLAVIHDPCLLIPKERSKTILGEPVLSPAHLINELSFWIQELYARALSFSPSLSKGKHQEAINETPLYFFSRSLCYLQDFIFIL